jgi:hypothetical protein
LDLEELVYKPNHAAPAPTTIDIRPDCSKLGLGKSINQKVVKYNKYIYTAKKALGIILQLSTACAMKINF